ncbi:MAG: hypothetical protein KKI15_02050 [Proteobacteria bacterium]|nr:hypothetical protein [Pseudomonadota bacterium]
MKKFLLYLTAISFLILSHGQTAFCEDSVDDGIADTESPAASDLESADDSTLGDDSPTFSNPAQAAHAASLAEAAAAEANEATADAQQAVSDAQDALADAEAAADQDAIEAAAEALAAAEDAYAEAIADLAGVLTADIKEMRDDNMGWGQIAHELGVQPGLLGLGYTHRNRHRNMISGETDLTAGDTEIAEATIRDTKTGWAKGHGLSTAKDSGTDKGMGLAKGAQTQGNSANVKGGSDNSSSARDSSGGPGNSGGSNSGGSNSDNGNTDKGKAKSSTGNGKTK